MRVGEAWAGDACPVRKQGALSLPMGVRASTRGTLEPDIWCKRLLCGGKGAKPSSDGLRLEASKVRNRAKSVANLGQLKDTAVGPSRSRHGDGGEPTWPAKLLSLGGGARGPDESQHLHSEPKGLPHSGDLSYFAASSVKYPRAARRGPLAGPPRPDPSWPGVARRERKGRGSRPYSWSFVTTEEHPPCWEGSLFPMAATHSTRRLQGRPGCAARRCNGRRPLAIGAAVRS